MSAHATLIAADISIMEPVCLGIMWDTDPGSFQLVVYRAGILGLHVGVWNRILFACRYVNTGAPVLAETHTHSPLTREERRVHELIGSYTPQQLVAREPRAFFIPQREIITIRLRYRLSSSRLSIGLVSGAERTFSWTPSMNPLPPVRQLLSAAFGDRLQ
jgi:hypothetical protein